MARERVAQQGQEIWAFANPGDKHEGVYRGTKVLDPQYKELFIVGDKLVKNTKQTADALENLNVGAYVWLEFRGKVAIKGGKTVNNFIIDVDREYNGGSPFAADEQGPAEKGDEEVPF